MKFFLLLLFSLPAPLSWAENVEKRAAALEKEILAPCCWVNPLSEHHSDVSYQLKGQIRDWLAAGQSDEQIRDLLVAQYSERILAKPRSRGFTKLVWWTPPLLFIAVIFLAGRFFWKRARTAPSLPERGLKGISPPQSALAQELKEAGEII